MQLTRVQLNYKVDSGVEKCMHLRDGQIAGVWCNVSSRQQIGTGVVLHGLVDYALTSGVYCTCL